MFQDVGSWLAAPRGCAAQQLIRQLRGGFDLTLSFLVRHAFHISDRALISLFVCFHFEIRTCPTPLLTVQQVGDLDLSSFSSIGADYVVLSKDYPQ